MLKRMIFSAFPTKRRQLVAVLLIGVFLALAPLTTVDFEGDFQGLYLFQDAGKFSFTLQNDIFLGDESKLLLRLDFEPLFGFFATTHKSDVPYLNYEWSNRLGRGFIINHLPGGKKLLTCLGRFRDSDGAVPKGLFVGGGLPASKKEDIEVTMNETGMAFYDGREWQHLWCSVNEAFAASNAPERMMPPSQWKFLGSQVLENSSKKLVLHSRHEVTVDGAPLAIDRFAFFRASDSYFILAMQVTNRTNRSVTYHYVYGDEPWVGEFGTSVGNVGWVRDRIYYYEGEVDPRKYSFAGIYDDGNKMILGGKTHFSGYANFIEWLGENRPDLVYFSNAIGQFSPESKHVPLYSKDNRVIFLQWGPRCIKPGESHHYLLAIGMAGRSSSTGLPVKPEVVLDGEHLRYLK